MGSLGEVKGKEMVLNPLDPVVIELKRLENNIRGIFMSTASSFICFCCTWNVMNLSNFGFIVVILALSSLNSIPFP